MKYRLGDICTITKGNIGIMKAIPGDYTMIALGELNKTHNEISIGCQNILNSYQSDFDFGKNRDAGFIYGPNRPRTVFFSIKYGLI